MAPVRADGSAVSCRTELGDLCLSWDLANPLLGPRTWRGHNAVRDSRVPRAPCASSLPA